MPAVSYDEGLALDLDRWLMAGVIDGSVRPFGPQQGIEAYVDVLRWYQTDVAGRDILIEYFTTALKNVEKKIARLYKRVAAHRHFDFFIVLTIVSYRPVKADLLNQLEHLGLFLRELLAVVEFDCLNCEPYPFN
jgi:hypothetical protein